MTMRGKDKDDILFEQSIFRVLYYAQAYRAATTKRRKARLKKAGLRSLDTALSLL